MNMFTREQVHAMLDDIRDANTSITCGAVIKRIRDDIDASPPSVPPDPRQLGTADTLAQELILRVAVIGYSDQGDHYEVDAEGWEALQRLVEQNISQETIRVIREAARLRRDDPVSSDDADHTEGESPYDEHGNLVKGDFDDDEDEL